MFELALEAMSRVRAHGIRLFTTSLVVGGLVVGTGVSNALSIADIEAALEEHRKAGGFVYVLESQRDNESSGVVKGDECEALARVEGIRMAGALRREGIAVTTTGQQTLATSATAGLVSTLEDRQVAVADLLGVSEPAVVVGAEAAARIGIATGSTVAFASSEANVEQSSAHLVVFTLASSPRTSSVAGHVVRIAGGHETDFDECWVEFEPAASVVGQSAVAAWLGTSHELRVRNLAGRDLTWEDLRARYLERSARSGWIGAGLVLSMLLALLVWLDRAWLAIYLSLGLRRVELMFIVAVEYYFALSVGSAIGVAWAVFLSGADTPSQLHAVIRSGIGVVSLGAIAVPFAVFCAVRAPLGELIREQG